MQELVFFALSLASRQNDELGSPRLFTRCARSLVSRESPRVQFALSAWYTKRHNADFTYAITPCERRACHARTSPALAWPHKCARLFAIVLSASPAAKDDARHRERERFRSLSLLLKASLLSKLFPLARARTRRNDIIADYSSQVITFAQRNDRIVSGQQGHFTQSGRSSWVSEDGTLRSRRKTSCTHIGTDSHLRRTGHENARGERVFTLPLSYKVSITRDDDLLAYGPPLPPVGPRAQDVNSVTAEDKTTGPSGLARNRIVVCAPFNASSGQFRVRGTNVSWNDNA